MENQSNNINQEDFNTRCEHFRQKIYADINESNLPIAPVFYIIDSLYKEIQQTYYTILNSEAKEFTETREGEDVLNAEL